MHPCQLSVGARGVVVADIEGRVIVGLAVARVAEAGIGRAARYEEFARYPIHEVPPTVQSSHNSDPVYARSSDDQQRTPAVRPAVVRVASGRQLDTHAG